MPCGIMVEKTVECFNLGQICESGQCFRMAEKEKHLYSIIAGGFYLEVKQEGNRCVFDCGEEEFEQFWKRYFSLEEDYGFYIAKVNEQDRYLKNAVEFGSGIRILQQDLWEVIVSFLISQQNNITRIRRCINNICESYGEERIDSYGQPYYTFPEPGVLAVLEEDALMACNLGYRSKYVVRTAKSVASGEADLKRISQMSYEEAKEELLKLYGVGEKVAECICLFALHHLQAFPVDTHINRALQLNYKTGFPKSSYKGFEGIMQQYIFYYELFGGKRANYV